MHMSKVFLILAAMLAVAQPSVAAKLTTCQKAYFMLRQCASEVIGFGVAGPQCCELLAAFDLRDCLHVDPRLQAFATKTVKSMQLLRATCANQAKEGAAKKPVKGATTTNKVVDEKALEAASQGVSQVNRGDGSMLQEVESIAAAVLDSGVGVATTATTTTTTTIDVAVEGERNEVRGAIAAATSSIKKKGAAILNEISFEVAEEIVEQQQPHANNVCSCQNAEMRKDEEVGSLKYAYLALRLRLCKLICAHRQLVLGALLVQMVALAVWIVCLLARPHWLSSSLRHTDRRLPTSQFIVDASDPHWTVTEPLLSEHDPEGGMNFGQR